MARPKKENAKNVIKSLRISKDDKFYLKKATIIFKMNSQQILGSGFKLYISELQKGNPLIFKDWLLLNHLLDNYNNIDVHNNAQPINDLADDIQKDQHFPDTNCLPELVTYIKDSFRSAATATMLEAIKEYKKYRKEMLKNADS